MSQISHTPGPLTLRKLEAPGRWALVLLAQEPFDEDETLVHVETQSGGRTLERALGDAVLFQHAESMLALLEEVVAAYRTMNVVQGANRIGELVPQAETLIAAAKGGSL